MVFPRISRDTKVFISTVSPGILGLNENKPNRPPMTTAIGGLIQCLAKKATKITTVRVMNSDASVLNQSEWKELK